MREISICRGKSGLNMKAIGSLICRSHDILFIRRFRLPNLFIPYLCVSMEKYGTELLILSKYK